MVYAIRFLPSAARELRKLNRQAQMRIAEKIDALAQEPRPSGCKALDSAEGLLRIRVGDYRVIYRVDDDVRVLEVLVVRVGHRRDVYRYLKKL